MKARYTKKINIAFYNFVIFLVYKQYRNIKVSDLVLHYLMYTYCAELAEMLERMNIR